MTAQTDRADGFYAIKMNSALKMHFDENIAYDFFKYGGVVNLAYGTFKNRRDRWNYEKLAKKYKTQEAVKHFFLANHVVDSTFYGSNCMSQQAHENYNRWARIYESSKSSFIADLQSIDALRLTNNLTWLQVMGCEGGHHPVLYKMYLQDIISIETLTKIVHTFRLDALWSANMEYDPIWKYDSARIKRYAPFIDTITVQQQRDIREAFNKL